MKTKKSVWKRLSLGLAAVALGAALTSCSSGNAKKESSKNEINWVLPNEIQTLDISKLKDMYSAVAIGNSGSNLLRIDKDGKPQPDLAEKVEVSKDGLTYTATLRDGIKWSDGSDITAEDFVYSWQRIVDPKTAAEYAYLAIDAHVVNAKEVNEGSLPTSALGVKAEGNKVIFTLNNPSPQFMYFLAFSNFAPQKKTFVEKTGDKYATNADNQLYSGPYTVEGWSGTNNTFTLKKNKYYWDAKRMKGDTVNVEVIKKPESAVEKYKRGEVDFAEISDTSALYKANKNNKDVVDVLEATTSYIEYNQTGTNKALANKKIRQALNLATDRKSLVEAAINTGSRAATGLAPYGLAKVGNKDLSEYVAPGYKTDMKEAKKLFKEGLAEIGETEVAFTMTADSDRPVSKAAADYLKESWEKNLPGLTVEQKFVPFKQRLQDSQTQNFDLVISLWGGDYPEGSTFYGLFTLDSSHNHGKVVNEEYDKIYTEAITTNALAPEKAAENYKAAEKALYDEANINPLYFRSRQALQNPDIKGIISNTTGLNFDFTYAYKD